MTVRAIGCFVCVAAVCLPLLAHGEGEADAGAFAVALEYASVHGCPDVSEFKAIVLDRLGYDPFLVNAPDRVLVDIVSRGSAFEGRIERRNAEGKWAGDRTFPSRSEDCGELGRAMAFALALQIQFSTRASASQGENKPAAPTEPDKTTEPVASAPPTSMAVKPDSKVREDTAALTKGTTSRDQQARPTLAAGAGASGGFGLSSTTVPFARGFGSVAWQHLSLELAGEVAWPTTTRREDGAGFSQQQFLIGLAGCGLLQAWSACLLAKTGGMRVVGKDVDRPRSSTGPILETGLRVAVQLRLGRYLYLAARADGLINMTSWRVTLDQNLVWTSPRFAATVGLDFGVRFVRDTVSDDAIAQDSGRRDE
jgi:hypothetical protein